MKKTNINWYYYGKASVIVGIVFALVTLITGSLWFNATSGFYQNIYWQWSDARQTSTFVLFVAYVGYLVFQNLVQDRSQRAKMSSLLGIILFPMVPLSYASAIIFNSLHPLINPNPGQTGHIYWSSINIFALLFNLIAISIFWAYAVKKLVEIEKERANLDTLIQQHMEAN